MAAMRGIPTGLGIACLAVALTAPVAHATPSFMPPGKAFGFSANLRPADEPGISIRTLDAAVAAGASHLRMTMSWRAYEQETSADQPVPPSFSKAMGTSTGNAETDRMDKRYQLMIERGITPVLVIHNAPAWASTFHTCLTNPVDRLDTKKCPKDWQTRSLTLYPALDRHSQFAAFVRAVANRYPAAVIEGTNEPDFHFNNQPALHPPIDVVAAAQCALADAVRSTGPGRIVLSASTFTITYTEPYIKAIGRRDCYDYLSFHLFGGEQYRTGSVSSPADSLYRLRNLLRNFGGGDGIWLTETGLTDTVRYNDINFNDKAEMVGEPMIARAFPSWVTYFAQQPDIAGVMVWTVRQGANGEATTSDKYGFGLLTKDYAVRPAGENMPRWCWLVLSAGNSYPGCEGWSLPGPPAPARPTFYRAPHLLWGKDTKIGKNARVQFLEEGEPDPTVSVTWYRCNALGASCGAVGWQRSSYLLTSADHFKRIKCVVRITNASGSLTRETVLSPVVEN